MAARKKVGELQDYKDRRRRQREINNLEERVLLDQIAEGQKRRPAAPAGGTRDRLPLAKDKDVRQLQIEVRRLYRFLFLSLLTVALLTSLCLYLGLSLCLCESISVSLSMSACGRLA